MKKIFFTLVLLSSVALAGCKQEEVYEDQRMSSSSDKEMKVEYNIYNEGIIDSGYNWYSNYVNSFISSIKDSGYSVDKSAVEDQVEKVNRKYKEISEINPQKVKSAIDKTEKDLSKNDSSDKTYKDEMKKSKSKIENNIDTMKNILSDIENALKLGEDGKYDEFDLKKLEELQVQIIKIYDEKLKEH
ncbi:hypothetical protein [Peptostreptococcus faecalis]|uniref:hypothetical protein n=1 Tax=Peptostreptococcus faecalis TaxID=2045015 RepID=UPI000C7B46CB|nr:hypothetical protein [Peptostreptococcus faecalis]